MIDSFPFLRYCQEEEKEDGAYRKILEIPEDKLDDIYYCYLTDLIPSINDLSLKNLLKEKVYNKLLNVGIIFFRYSDSLNMNIFNEDEKRKLILKEIKTFNRQINENEKNNNYLILSGIRGLCSLFTNFNNEFSKEYLNAIFVSINSCENIKDKELLNYNLLKMIDRVLPLIHEDMLNNFPYKLPETYLKRLEIKKGKAILDTKDVTEIEIARSLGINVNPYEISEDGELISSNGNLLLIDTNGTLELPDTVITIGEGAFANTASDGIVLRKVIIPYTVKEIKQNAFNGNNTIEEVEFQTKSGKGVTKIGDFAFANCTNLKSIVIPDTVTDIGAGGIANCSALKKLVIPSTLNSISDNVFYGSNSIEEINIKDGSGFVYENGMLINKNRTNIYYLSESAVNIETFIVPQGITTLGANLLRNNKIKKVVIPSSVNYIEVDFFTSNVDEIEIATDNPKYIVSNDAIYSKDKKILYMYFSKGSEVTLEDGVTTIGPKAFKNARASIIKLPQSVKELSAYAIYTSYVKKVVIGENINNINRYAFYACDLDLEMKKNNYYIWADGLLYNKDKTKVIECTKNLQQVEIPEGVVEIGDNAFQSRGSIKNIKLASTVSKIGNGTFAGCNGFVEIEIPSKVTVIGTNCFESTNNLKKIVIKKEKESIAGAPWGNRYGDRAIEWNSET